MSLQDTWNEEIPEDTARVGQAILSDDSPYRLIGDEAGSFLSLNDFALMYSIGGRGAICPIILALVTVFQALEGIPDRVAAEWAVTRLDWKYALHLSLTWRGFHYSDLSNFRKRMIEHGQERWMFDRVLDWVRSHGLLKRHSKQRTDSTHVLGQVARLSRLELVWETLRKVLRAMEKESPTWYSTVIPAAFHEAYSVRQSDWRLSQADVKQKMGDAGRDGYWLLDSIETQAPSEVQDLTEVETLRTVLSQQYQRLEGKVTVRKPPIKGKDIVVSPHETEARWAKKRSTQWRGYKVHVTETVVEKEETDEEDRDVSFLTDIETSAANDGDNEAVDEIQDRLEARDLRPEKHYLDQGYVSGPNLAHSADAGTILMGPAPANTSRKPEGYRQSDFQFDWARQEATCPEGQKSMVWYERPQEDGYVGAEIQFQTNCDGCAERAQCAPGKCGRTLTVSPYHEHLDARRAEQQTTEFWEEMKHRPAIEGTLSALVRKHGARRARYRGKAKVRLQHLSIGAAVNIKRLTRALATKESCAPAMAAGC